MKFHHPSERGFVLIWMAIMLFTFLIIAALIVDIGSQRAAGVDAQKAADAAALAGAPYLTQPGGWDAFTEEGLAKDVALQVAAENGFVEGEDDVESIDVQTVLDGAGLKVTIKLDTNEYFSGIVGADLKVTRSSIAEYNPPVQIGNPNNVFGNEPGPSKKRYCPEGGDSCDQPGFWANIAGPITRKVEGDPFGGQACFVNYFAGWPPSDYCEQADDGKYPGKDPLDRQYTYVLRKATTNSALVEVFDPIFVNVSSQAGVCTGDNLEVLGAGLEEEGGGRFDAGANNPYCTGDDQHYYPAWTVYREPPGAGCGFATSPSAATDQPSIDAPESFGNADIQTVAADSDLLAIKNNGGCAGPDHPITSYRITGPNGYKCEKGFDFAPATPTELIEGAENQVNPGAPQVAGRNFPQLYLPNLDPPIPFPGVPSNTAGSMERERQRVYNALNGPAAGRRGVSLQDFASGMNNGDFATALGPVSVADERGMFLPGERFSGFYLDRRDLPAGNPVRNQANIFITQMRNTIRENFRDWSELCTLPSGNGSAGDYRLEVRTDTYYRQTNGSNVGLGQAQFVEPLRQKWFRGAGSNRYSLRVSSGAGNDKVSIFPEQRQGIYTNFATSGSYIARVTPSTTNRTLRMEFYDTADSTGGSGELTIDLNTVSANGDLVDRNVGPCEPLIGGFNVSPTSWVTTPTGCRIKVNTNTTNGKTIVIQMKVPNASGGYSCDAGNPFDCWIQGTFDFGGAKARDATTWTARMIGQPTRIDADTG